jgi:hypothetical protein
MIRAKKFRIAPFEQRFTESAFENLFAFKAGEADEDVENKTIGEKRLVLANERAVDKWGLKLKTTFSYV